MALPGAVFGVTTGVVLALVAAACHHSSQRISLDNSSNGQTLSVTPGDEIDVTLQTIGPGEYEAPVVSSGSVRFLGESAAEPPNPGGLRQLFRFEAVTVGRAEIRISHTSLDPPSLQTPPFVIVVDVR